MTSSERSKEVAMGPIKVMGIRERETEGRELLSNEVQAIGLQHAM